MCGVDDEHVDTGSDERLGAFDRVLRHTHRGAAAQAAEGILRGVRVLHRLLDVLHRDQTLEPERGVDNQQLLDLVPMENFARGVERGADRDGDEVLTRHDVGDRPLHVRLEAQVAVGEDADEASLLAAVIGDRHTRDPVLLHELERFEDAVRRRQRDRVDDHAALGALDTVDFRGLLVDREVLVDDAEAALLRHGNGEA